MVDHKDIRLLGLRSLSSVFRGDTLDADRRLAYRPQS